MNVPVAGVIDYLQEWNTVKRLERFIKTRIIRQPADGECPIVMNAGAYDSAAAAVVTLANHGPRPRTLARQPCAIEAHHAVCGRHRLLGRRYTFTGQTASS